MLALRVEENSYGFSTTSPHPWPLPLTLSSGINLIVQRGFLTDLLLDISQLNRFLVQVPHQLRRDVGEMPCRTGRGLEFRIPSQKRMEYSPTCFVYPSWYFMQGNPSVMWPPPRSIVVSMLERGTQKLPGVDRSAQTRQVHIKSPRLHLHTPPNPTCIRWYDHEWLKAGYKPDAPTPTPTPSVMWQ